MVIKKIIVKDPTEARYMKNKSFTLIEHEHSKSSMNTLCSFRRAHHIRSSVRRNEGFTLIEHERSKSSMNTLCSFRRAHHIRSSVRRNEGFTLIEHERSKSVRRNEGFTLIELLVVIAIIGLLAGIVWVGLDGARLQAKITKAGAEANVVYKAVKMLHADTGKYPRVNDINLTDDFKTYLAPYLSDITDDPWGNPYFYDGCPEPCEDCVDLTWNAICESGQWQTSVCSGGPDGVIESQDVEGPVGDDICVYFK